jgi:hypothetical protein
MNRLRSMLRLVVLSARLIGGRRFWLAPILPLAWPAFQAFRLLVGWRDTEFVEASAQNTLIALPLIVLAIGLGVRIIAGEMDRRTLEMAYTVPGGAHRVWLAKIAAAVMILGVALILLAIVTYSFFTSFPLGALYGAFQGSVFYLVLAMGFAALFKSEITGAMATVAVVALNGLFTGFGQAQLRISPLFNALAEENTNPSDLLASVVQNRIGFVLAIAAVTALAFVRAERREKLLGG